jgi:nitroreductase
VFLLFSVTLGDAKMTFLQLARKRYSVRSYKNRKVEKKKLEYVLEAARLAPTAVNFQPFHFIVMQDEKKRLKIARTYKKTWIRTAPVIIVICGDHTQSWRRGDGKDHCDIDAAIAIDHMTLAAAEKGLGTCWVCKFDAFRCHELLKLPNHIEPIALLPLGYPEKEKDLKRHNKRKSLNELVQWDGFVKIPKS